MKRLLVQTQMSNYDSKGKFILECDSGWQMVMGRVREMLRLNPTLDITVMGPTCSADSDRRQVITDPWDINPDLWERYGHDGENRLHYLEHEIIPNALVTRYDFDWTAVATNLDLGMQKIGAIPRWDAVYVNDPMHLRAFKAMFHVVGGYVPRFYVHSHFIDNPECPKFPTEASLWLGQCEAAIKADHNFWQCESSMNTFFGSMERWFAPQIVNDVRARSTPWDDGYSREEITSPIDESKLRFTAGDWARLVGNRTVIFVPNRIGGMGRGSDYTNCGKFMFNVLPELAKRRFGKGLASTADYAVVCGNPNQKFLNDELEQLCGKHGYVKLVPDSLNRDEFKFVARRSQIALGLYDQDTYGGTAARECVELGCLPLWLDCNEYSALAQRAGGGYPFLIKTDWSDMIDRLELAIDVLRNGDARGSARWVNSLRDAVRAQCSYEATTPTAMKRMGLLEEA